jgi:hypothetical protein
MVAAIFSLLRSKMILSCCSRRTAHAALGKGLQRLAGQDLVERREARAMKSTRKKASSVAT